MTDDELIAGRPRETALIDALNAATQAASELGCTPTTAQIVVYITAYESAVRLIVEADLDGESPSGTSADDATMTTSAEPTTPALELRGRRA